MNRCKKIGEVITSVNGGFLCVLGMTLLAMGCRDAPDKQASTTKASASAVSASPLIEKGLKRLGPAPSFTELPAGPNSEAPNLIVATDSVLASWIENIDGHPTIRWARFRSGQWSAANTVIKSDDLLVNWADVPAIAEAGDSIWVAFPEENPGHEGYRAALVRSLDGGKSFVRQGALHSDTSDSEHGFVAFVLEDKNTVRAFWLDGRATIPGSGKTEASLAMQLYSAVVGHSVTNEVLLDEKTCDCCNLGVGRSAIGSIVAYRDRDAQEVRDISVIHSEGKVFSKPAIVQADAYRIAGCPVNGPAIATDGSRVALAWYTYANEEPRITMAFSIDGGAYFGNGIKVAESNGSVAPLGRVAVAWADQNDAMVAYVESDREKAKIVVRRAQSNGTIYAPLVIAETRPDRKNGFPKMVSFDEQLLVVWTDGDNPLRVRAKRLPWASVPRQMAKNEANEPIVQLINEGDPFPVFDVQSTEGKTISTETLRGKPALVNIWASYCEPCRQEIPNLSRIHQKYKKKGLRVVGLAMDERLTGEGLDKLAKKRGIDYTLWQDPEDRAGKALGVRVLPVTFLVDARGKVVYVRRGAVQENDAALEKSIQGLL